MLTKNSYIHGSTELISDLTSERLRPQNYEQLTLKQNGMLLK